MTDNQTVAGLGCVHAPSLGDTLLYEKGLNATKSTVAIGFLVTPRTELATNLATKRFSPVNAAWGCHACR